MMAAPTKDSRFRLSEAAAQELASTYGTPLYVLHEQHLRDRIRRYLNAFRSCYPQSEITFASKANVTLAVLAIAHAEGCRIDAASEGEFRAALAAGVPAAHCHFHGNNKSLSELRFALKEGIGQIIIDNFEEIENVVEALRTQPNGNTEFLLRLAPGVDPITHEKISTGSADTKFGFNIADGSAERAMLRVLELGLKLVGFHCHVGSQLLDPEAQRLGGEAIAQFAVQMKRKHGFETTYLNMGGGLGVRYSDQDEPMEVAQYCELVVRAVLQTLAGADLRPTLGQEPGRSLVAESGVTLYSVGAVKTVPSPTRGERTYVVVDGGLSDNPRPALYGSRFTVLPIHASFNPRTVTVSGKHCETDKLFEDVELPQAIKAGDLIQVLCTGAYNSSMASNYNQYQRPATALLRPDGRHVLVQRRETWEEMLSRDRIPEDLAKT